MTSNSPAGWQAIYCNYFDYCFLLLLLLVSQQMIIMVIESTHQKPCANANISATSQQHLSNSPCFFLAPEIPGVSRASGRLRGIFFWTHSWDQTMGQIPSVFAAPGDGACIAVTLVPPLMRISGNNQPTSYCLGRVGPRKSKIHSVDLMQM